MLIRPNTRKLILPGMPEWQDDRQTLCNLFDELLMGAGKSSGIWTVKLWGAAGGNVLATGGKGGFVSGTVSLKSGDVLDIYVGNGGAAETQGYVPSAGGATPDPNGGSGGIGGYAFPPLTAGAGGGARTSLYLNSVLLAVAGGGGGAGNRNVGPNGFDAGGLTGVGWLGGTQTGPGPGGGTSEAPGQPGQGPNGGASPPWGDSVGGGGGGGYWGGGGGGSAGGGQSGGGGGSSYSGLLGNAVNITGPNSTDPHFGNNAATPAATSYTRGGPGRCVLISPTGQVYVFDYTGSGVRFTVP
ncbi:glycine-rich protein [Azospirillum sp.]|uniref:glycine-rich protein n=1 Tax=Azospirillum sp. TaxID=34012 RepID=UPI002D74C450|nr:glycine-rich protein [Azospirillum sp.]HYF87433.1 glycine-rich protein [Azospirillum sp.]